MAFTQTHSKKHLHSQADLHTHQHTHIFRDKSWLCYVCEANSFCHKWSQIGSGQSPITSHLGWPLKKKNNTQRYTHLHTPSNAFGKQVRHRSGHRCRSPHPDRPTVVLIVTLSRWDHFYRFRKTGRSDQCYLLVCCVIRAEPQCQNIPVSFWKRPPSRRKNYMFDLRYQPGRHPRRQGHLRVICSKDLYWTLANRQ